MFGFSALKDLGKSAAAASNRRRAGRLACSMVYCQFGEIADLSVTGVRVASRRRSRLTPGTRVNLEFGGLPRPYAFPATVVRVIPGRPCHIAFEFAQLDPEQQKLLRELARTAADGRTLGRESA